MPADTPTDSVLAVGETWRQDGLELTLDDVSFERDSYRNEQWVTPHFVLYNATDQKLQFEFNPRNLAIADNTEKQYERERGGDDVLRFSLDPGEAEDTLFGSYTEYHGNYYDANVQYLLVTVKDCGRINEAQWRVEITH
jgi:hypothetical protein